MSSLVLVVRNRNLKAVYGAWVEKCADETLPMASSFEPGDLRPWLDNIVLIDVGDAAGHDMRYSYYGDGLLEAFGVDLTGQPVEPADADTADLLAEDYRQVVSGRLPVARIVNDTSATGAGNWEGLMLPLFDDDGSVVKILGAMYPVD
jgi:hypothetical protein